MAARNDVSRTTARLALREPRPDDAAALRAYYARNAARFAPWEPPRSSDVAEHARWIAETRAAAARDGRASAFLAFDATVPSDLAGVVTLHGFSWEPPSAMLAYTVDGAYEGRGYASEAVRSVIAYAFDELGLDALSASYHPANARSEALLVRAGFTLAGVTPVIPGLEGVMRASALAVLTRATPPAR